MPPKKTFLALPASNQEPTLSVRKPPEKSSRKVREVREVLKTIRSLRSLRLKYFGELRSRSEKVFSDVSVYQRVVPINARTGETVKKNKTAKRNNLFTIDSTNVTCTF